MSGSEGHRWERREREEATESSSRRQLPRSGPISTEARGPSSGPARETEHYDPPPAEAHKAKSRLVLLEVVTFAYKVFHMRTSD